MKSHFERIFDDAKKRGITLNIELVGDRPCMGKVDLSKIAQLTQICSKIIEETANIKTRTHSSSTDCNIPLSLAIPALCVGTYNGGGAHTREEWVEKASLPIGLEVGIKIATEIVKLV
jgi:di/tripeptidase